MSLIILRGWYLQFKWNVNRKPKQPRRRKQQRQKKKKKKEQKRSCLHLTNLGDPNRRDKVWKDTNQFFSDVVTAVVVD